MIDEKENKNEELEVNLEEVGLPSVVVIAVSNPDVVVDALVVNLAAIPEFHVNVLPLEIVATST